MPRTVVRKVVQPTGFPAGSVWAYSELPQAGTDAFVQIAGHGMLDSYTLEVFPKQNLSATSASRCVLGRLGGFNVGGSYLSMLKGTGKIVCVFNPESEE